MKVNQEGSVRVDLLGGTLDISPINLILRNTVTLNVATTLKAKVELEATNEDCVEIISKDYDSTSKFYAQDFIAENFDSDHFGPLSFVCQILDHFEIRTKVKLTLESGSPPGAGLGGSSSMGVTLYKALCEFTDSHFDRLEAITVVQSIEAKILNKGPCGYQDYYPALFGGILALRPGNSMVIVEQLFNDELKQFLEERLTLIYSGSLRLSAINNWEVYKSFFDNKDGVREGLQKIEKLSQEAYLSLQYKDYEKFLLLLAMEGAQREKLFENIVTEETRSLYNELCQKKLVQGMKVCGAGGGGCFIVTHKAQDRDKIREVVAGIKDMKVLEYQVDTPIND